MRIGKRQKKVCYYTKTQSLYFIFLVVVNMILINMMMAIINLSFEEIKNNGEQYKNKFELIEYVKRTAKEMVGVMIAEPIVPVYLVSKVYQDNFTMKLLHCINMLF